MRIVVSFLTLKHVSSLTSKPATAALSDLISNGLIIIIWNIFLKGGRCAV